jgi:putative ABC transport system permease protein
MENLITANIRSRPTRTIISILAVALGVILLLVIGGFAKGTLNDYLNRTLSLGADFIFQEPESSIFYALSDATLNEKFAPEILKVPGVAAVTPVLSKMSASYFGLVFGIDWITYNQFPGRLHIVSGRASLTDDEVIVDKSFADAKKLTPGMKLNVLNHEFAVSAICRPGAIVRVFVPLKTFQKLNGTLDKVTIMFIKAAPQADLDKVEKALRKRFWGYSIIRADNPDLLLAEARLPGLKEFRWVLITVSMMLSFMVILLAMYTTIFERTREIGILKSLGASQRFIVGMILKESAIICSLGSVLGIVASEIIREAIIARFPMAQVSMTTGDWIRGLMLGLLAGTLGALYPAYKAARMDPVKALSYE